MPTGITVAELIPSALRRAGVLAQGEVAQPDEFNDSLLVLRDVLENWSTESLSVWDSKNVSFSLVPGKAQYTIGAGGDFNTSRPGDIADVYVDRLNVSFPVRVIDQLEYNSIAVKTVQTLPERMLYVKEYPLGVLTFYPVPDFAYTATFSMQNPLLQMGAVDVNTVLSGPPGFTKALRLTLALELCGEFQVPPDKLLIDQASDAKADYKRSNIRVQPSHADNALLGVGVALWQRGY